MTVQLGQWIPTHPYARAREAQQETWRNRFAKFIPLRACARAITKAPCGPVPQGNATPTRVRASNNKEQCAQNGHKARSATRVRASNNCLPPVFLALSLKFRSHHFACAAFRWVASMFHTSPAAVR